MKKILLAVLCVVMIFVSCACGDDSSVSAKNVPEASANADSETLESESRGVRSNWRDISGRRC